MKKCMLIIVVVLSIVSCDAPEVIDPTEDITENDTISQIDTCFADTCYTCNLTNNAKVIYDKLIQAYNDSDYTAFEDVFIEWSNNSIPDNDIPDSLVDLYDVYAEFYSPWDLERISDSTFRNSGNKIHSFYIIQSTLEYSYNLGTSGKEIFELNSFRPWIKNDTIQLLYLDDDYEAAITCFLGTEYEPVNFENIITPNFPGEEITRRNNFLSKYVGVFYSHWGDYWHLETNPEVWSINFNESRDTALVSYRLFYQAGEAILGKENDKWNIVDHYMTMIE